MAASSGSEENPPDLEVIGIKSNILTNDKGISWASDLVKSIFADPEALHLLCSAFNVQAEASVIEPLQTGAPKAPARHEIHTKEAGVLKAQLLARTMVDSVSNIHGEVNPTPPKQPRLSGWLWQRHWWGFFIIFLTLAGHWAVNCVYWYLSQTIAVFWTENNLPKISKAWCRCGLYTKDFPDAKSNLFGAGFEERLKTRSETAKILLQASNVGRINQPFFRGRTTPFKFSGGRGAGAFGNPQYSRPFRGSSRFRGRPARGRGFPVQQKSQTTTNQ